MNITQNVPSLGIYISAEVCVQAQVCLLLCERIWVKLLISECSQKKERRWGVMKKRKTCEKDACQKGKKDGNRRKQKIKEEQKIRTGKCDQK